MKSLVALLFAVYNAFMDYLQLNGKKLVENLLYWQQLAQKNGACLNVVTKFCISEIQYIDLLVKNGVTTISDSNMQNFATLPLSVRESLKCCVIKTRLSDIDQYSQSSALSESSPIRFYLSDEECLKKIRKIPENCRPQIVLIMECGDYKDGLYQSDIKRLVLEYADLPIMGVSANFACLSGKMPDIQSLSILSETALYIQQVKNLDSPFVSVGGTVMHDMLVSDEITACKDVFVSEIRCGEGIFFGYNSSKGAPVDGLWRDVFNFMAEIIEVQEKTIPEQKSDGLNALGDHSASRPSGARRCAVLDFGVLAAPQVEIFPRDTDILIIGQTFDFTVIDITDSKKRYNTGDFVSFSVNYASASFLCMNRFITKTVE